MKIKYSKELKNGKRHMLVELDPKEKLMTIDEDGYYKTGYPHEEVVGGHVIAEAVPVTWCSLGQEWVS